ncbi:MAG: MAPEG family protein [Cyanobacteria bacterium]|nr:MAPEG family protein [Cyanobacteriota bacterium]MDA0865527.1 MAPEG family protein [Cyanobacteriota bacterium]
MNLAFLGAVPIPGLLLCCMVLAAILIYVPFGVVAIARFQVGYDPSAPRALFDQLPPHAQRATWAHENSFEAFTLFAPAVLAAYVTGQDSTLALGAAIAHVVARLLYSLFYILDKPLLRSPMYAIAALGTFTLFAMACTSALR